jgi:hypothetical protein
MNEVCSSTKQAVTVIVSLFVTTCFSHSLISAEKTYFPKSADESEVLSLVLKSEVQANRWTKKEVVCFSVQGMDPSPKLVKALRQQELNVCSSAEWRRRFNCGFEVRLQFLGSDSLRSTRVHAVVADLREINEGVGDLGILQRDGEYALQKIDGKWSISKYVPSKQAGLKP